MALTIESLANPMGTIPGLFNDPFGFGAAEDAFSEAAAAAQFSPYNIQTGAGSATFADGTATATLSPEMQAMYDQLFGGATQTLQQAQQYDPYAAAETLFGRMEGILAPSRDRERQQLEARLLSQGRLGSTGGLFDMQAQQGAVEAQRQAALNQAFGQAQQVQQGLFGQGLQQLQAAQGIQNMPLSMIGLGGNLGAAQSQAALGAGQLSTQGASLMPSFWSGLISGAVQGGAAGMTGGAFSGGGSPLTAGSGSNYSAGMPTNQWLYGQSGI